MNVSEAKAKFGEKLAAIEDLRENAHAHYLRIEEAVGHANLAEIQVYYACIHGMLPEDVVTDPRFPWHSNYKYGDASKCCAACQELEMAITVNITSTDLPLAKWFPVLTIARNPQEDCLSNTNRALHEQASKGAENATTSEQTIPRASFDGIP